MTCSLIEWGTDVAEIVLISRPTIIWPQDLPGKSLRDGYTGNTPFQGIRSTTDAGIDRVRATPTIPRKTWFVAYPLRKDQLVLLQNFVRIATGNYFLWPHPWGEKVLLVARFKEDGSKAFSDTKDSGLFHVPLNMETQQNVTFQYTEGPWPWR